MRTQYPLVPGTMNLLRFGRRPDLVSSLAAALFAAVICVSCARTGAGTGVTATTGANAAPLDRLVRDVCNKRIVLLGEDNHHAGGSTLVAKTGLVSRLIDECGFSAVIFEASLPEFIDLNRAFAAGKASPAHVADALGGLSGTVPARRAN